MDPKRLKDTSKFLSLVLRHQPDAIGLALDSEGWAEIDALIAGAAREGRRLDLPLIHAVVDTNDKKRFSLSADGRRIRAVQGHTTDSVNLSHVEKAPPDVLFHGTATRFLESILRQGLIPGSRHHVHLSHNIDTATAVGSRYGKPVVLTVEALRMQAQGFKFFQAENGVWLTAHVPVAFLRED
ncbi:RNA 2'-phosphotransferase [Pseudomonadota bacterium AL_CKDN230030165-1A_HGKHYDSX7]